MQSWCNYLFHHVAYFTVGYIQWRFTHFGTLAYTDSNIKYSQLSSKNRAYQKEDKSLKTIVKWNPFNLMLVRTRNIEEIFETRDFFLELVKFISNSLILFARNRISFTNTVTIRIRGIPFPYAFKPKENSAPENKSLQHSPYQISFN